mmetsp:Transcript_2840/g.7796  ORF Transcript_2840/g.7796 Transcript_2840/m.7796 type:complete len:435 (-) Transcript_2840:670-1974(-)|eukprot:CAMPEP_0197192896 /NCGR_PEP_ID=MMETSP1423-20130617/25981_1 /TAXON_ID=476441 /ORGANISM="Pseudo-nitzschia heimii, Strain UNC1101" /LENGTH=434 /DNA_ID=CAMNT_0042645899 /DNA_START=104 /DNA_END=1408 /DNA_ORIENTATION=-
MSYVPPHRRSSRRHSNKDHTPTTTDRAICNLSRARWQKHRGRHFTRKEDNQLNEDRLEKKKRECKENEIFFCNAFSFVRCINLSDRPEQWNRFRHHVRQIGSGCFLKKVERFDAVDGREVFRQARDKAMAEVNDADNDVDNPIETTAGVTITAKASPLDLNPISRIEVDVTLEWNTTQNSLWDRHVAPGMTRRMTAGEVGCALSHVSLWKKLVKMEAIIDEKSSNREIGDAQNPNDGNAKTELTQSFLSMLIFEDDAAFFQRKRHQKRSKRQYLRTNKEYKYENKPLEDSFLRAFRRAYTMLPEDWDIFYLGISDRGERRDLVSGRIASVYCREGEIEEFSDDENEEELVVQLFRPTYGFHTHAYAIRQSAAEKLLLELPVVGPIDVWLADNQWFGLKVYCAIIANEGWKKTGAPLIDQDRTCATTSSVGHSGR